MAMVSCSFGDLVASKALLFVLNKDGLESPNAEEAVNVVY
jgi:hypothetical protein